MSPTSANSVSHQVRHGAAGTAVENFRIFQFDEETGSNAAPVYYIPRPKQDSGLKPSIRKYRDRIIGSVSMSYNAVVELTLDG